MPEDDRAAKAARAKAMLKKRQREKAATGATSPGVGDTEVPSRTASPAPKEHVQKESRDLSDVFAKDDGTDTSWLSSLPPAETTSPPPSLQPTSPPPPANGVSEPPASAPSPSESNSANDKLQEELHNIKKRYEALEAELKQFTTLQTEVDTLRKRNATLETDSKQLAGIRSEVGELQKQNSALQANVKELANTQVELKELKARNLTLQDNVKRSESTLREAQSRIQEQERDITELNEKLLQVQNDTDAALENERQTISLLVSEKSSLAEELQRLEQVEFRLQSLESELDRERGSAQALEQRLQAVEVDKAKFEKLAQEEQAKSKELSDTLRDKEHELHNATTSLDHTKQEAERHHRRVRELEERIQNDDTVERLESSLKHTQDRAGELEFQLSKLKQAHSALKTERDDIEGKRAEVLLNSAELQENLTELQKLHDGLNEQLATAEAARYALAQEKAASVSETESLRASMAEMQEKLVEAAANLAQSSRQLQVANNELKLANKRTQEAENTQKELQTEGTSLMKSLDEMRPKIVELTGVKLELTETVSKLRNDLKNNEKVISDLETALSEATQKHEDLEAKTQELVSRHDKERTSSTQDVSELQKAHIELQKELDAAKTSLRSLESDRSGSQRDVARHADDLQKATSLLEQKSEELASLQQEIEALRGEQEENQFHLGDAQDEIEALRADLAVRNEEIQRLKEEAASPTRTGHPQSLDEELLSSLRQQHALDLSAAESQIRALENQVFEANARSHALQKQLGVVEDQLLQFKSRPSSRLGQRSYSPANRLRANDLRRSSISSQRPNGTTPLARSIFDQNMSAETKHKRLVSLSMLKARIDSEAEATVSRPSSRGSIRGLSPVGDDSRPGTPDGHFYSRPGRSQFLDDSHVFWCHSCTGDLVVL